MNRQEISISGVQILTLCELTKPGLKAIFIGINPSPVSVEVGHYYQGRLGKRFWGRLRHFKILPDLPHNAEDDFSFDRGFGFMDLVRNPTSSASELSRAAKHAAVQDLYSRLVALGARPLVIFVYSEAFKLCRSLLEAEGFEVVCMPGPYASTDIVSNQMKGLQASIRARG